MYKKSTKEIKFHFISKMEIIRNNKGGVKICYNGNIYTKKSSQETSIRWECSRRRALSCNGKIRTNIEMTEVLSSVEHKHENSQSLVEATKMRQQMKERATLGRGSTAQVFADSLEKLSENARLQIGRTNAIKRDIQRQRQAGRPKDPATLEEIDFPQEWTTTGEEEGRPFLIYDSGKEVENRIIIFSTQECLVFTPSSQIYNLVYGWNFQLSSYVIRATICN
jgi:hypothetical protein